MGVKPTVREPALQAILDAAVDAVVLIDHRGEIQAFNRAAEGLFGYSSAEAIGRNVGMLMGEADRASHDEHVARYLASGEPHIIGRGREVIAQRKGGDLFAVFLSVGVVPNGTTPQFLGFIRDLTPAREAEEQQQRLRERLILVSRLAMVGEIATGIAHEVNQPLAAITNYAWASQRLLGASNPDLGEVRNALREITTQVTRAADTIRRLRQLARSPQMHRAPTSINELITAIADLARGDAARHGVSCELALADRLPPLNLDGAQIQQALLNLLWNALQALSASRVRPRQVRICTGLNAERQVEIAICDNGPGVPEDVAARLFEPFFTTKPDGTGLGLAMSRTIAQAHGGTLNYCANTPTGACFIMGLPVD